MKKFYILLLVFASTFTFAQTVLGPGDIVVVGLSANINGCNGSTTGGQDEFSFVCFKDITVGTEFFLTDNGYERTTAGRFGDTEGVLRITRTTSTLVAGTVFTLTFSGVGTVNPDGNWTFNTVTGGGGITSLNMNAGGDQLFIFQGGSWVNPAGTHDAYFDGSRFISAYNSRTTWVADGTTQQSNKYPKFSCFHYSPSTATDFSKYSGAITSADQRTWIDRINNPANWTAYTSCSNYNAGGINYRAGYTLPISAGGYSDGVWVGNKSTNWFDCDNWQSMVVPTRYINVTIPSTSLREASIDYTAPFSDDFNDTAYCNNLDINDRKVAIENTRTSRLVAFGNVTIGTNGELDMSDGNDGTLDGHLILHGNFTNSRNDETYFKEGGSLVSFVGTGNQRINTGAAIEPFYDIDINKPSGLVILDKDIEVDKDGDMEGGRISMVNGKIDLNSRVLWISNDNANGIINNNINSYTYNGILKRQVKASTTYNYPVGSASNYQLATLVIASGSSISGSPDYINGNFNAFVDGSAPLLTEGGYDYNSILNAGYWTFSPSSTFSGSYEVILNESGYSNGGAPRYTVLKRNSSASAWALPGTLGTWSEVGGVVTTNRTAINAFSDFAIGRGVAVLSVDLLDFKAKPVGKTAELTWKVANEKDFDNYTIEFSTDGMKFVEIGKVKAANLNTYKFIHNTPSVGVNYYRLKMINDDETYTFSNIEAVLISDKEDINILVYPNPAVNEISILSNSEIEFVKIYDALSREIINTEVNSLTKTLDISTLAKGTYVLMFEMVDKNQIVKHTKIVIK
jgi:hypothetical protein